MNDVAGKNAEKIAGAVANSNLKFRGVTPKFQRPHRAIGKNDAVPARAATGVAFRSCFIRRGMGWYQPQAKLTVFIR